VNVQIARGSKLNAQGEEDNVRFGSQLLAGSSTDILQLLITAAMYERSSHSFSSIRIFWKGLALNAFAGFRLSDDTIPASLNCAP
jgi:hypothetical protein